MLRMPLSSNFPLILNLTSTKISNFSFILDSTNNSILFCAPRFELAAGFSETYVMGIYWKDFNESRCGNICESLTILKSTRIFF